MEAMAVTEAGNLSSTEVATAQLLASAKSLICIYFCFSIHFSFYNIVPTVSLKQA
jgi:hypothetical protein